MSGPMVYAGIDIRVGWDHAAKRVALGVFAPGAHETQPTLVLHIDIPTAEGLAQGLQLEATRRSPRAGATVDPHWAAVTAERQRVLKRLQQSIDDCLCATTEAPCAACKEITRIFVDLSGPGERPEHFRRPQ